MTNNMIILPLLPTTDAAARAMLLALMIDSAAAIQSFATREMRTPESSIYYGDDADYIPAAANILSAITSTYFEMPTIDTLYSILFDEGIQSDLDTADFDSPALNLIALDY